MMMLCWLMAAFAAPDVPGPDPKTDAGWTEVVARSTNPTSARWTASEASPFWEAACKGGREVACSVRDGSTVTDAIAVACPLDENGRPVDDAEVDVDTAACLGRFWSVERRDPNGAFVGYRALCDAGSDRACAEVARAHADGVGTFVSQRRARRMAEPLCADGLPAACIVLGRLDASKRPRRASTAFDLGIELGDIAALWEKVAVVEMDEVAKPMRQRACDEGHPAACLAIAQDLTRDAPDVSLQLVERACDLGSPDGCMRDMLTKYEARVISKRELASRLDSLCLEFENACIYAGFLGFGGDVRAFFPGSYAATEMQRITGQVVPFARDCLRDFRDREPDWEREVDLELEMWIDEEGVIQGIVPVTDADLEYQQCVARHTRGIQSAHLPNDGAARISDSMTLGMEAEIKVTTFKGASGSEQVQDLATLAYEEWTEAANACYMDNGGSAWDDVFTWIYGEILRDGSFVGTRLVESTGDKPTDACVLDLLQGIDLGKEYLYNEKVRVYIRFNVLYRAPRSRGRNHGEAADPDTYMNEEDRLGAGRVSPIGQ